MKRMAITLACAALALAACTSEPRIAADASAQPVNGETHGPRGSGTAAPRRVWAGGDVDASGSPSPDGRYLSFTDWSTGDLALRDLATGTSRRLTTTGAIHSRGDEFADGSRFSPDGTHIAYVWFSKEWQFELRIVGIDSAPPRVVYRNVDVSYPGPRAWTPDGKWILTVLGRSDRSNQIALVSATDGSVHVLKSLDWRSPGFLSISPNGRWIAYSFARDIFLLAIDGSRQTTAVEHPANDFVVGWSPDGERLLFGSDRGDNTGVWSIRVVDGRTQGDPVLVRKDMWHMRPIGQTKAGALFYALATGMSDIFVAPMDPATGRLLSEPRPLSKDPAAAHNSPAWSPSGRHLAYVTTSATNSGDAARITIRSLETGELRELHPEFGYLNRLLWSHDGRSLLLQGTNVKGRSGLFRMDLQTGALTPSVLLQGEDMPMRSVTLSRDGRHVYFASADTSKHNRIISHELKAGDRRELFRVDEGFLAVAPSPDGRSLAVAAVDEGGGWSTLGVMPSDGGAMREVVRIEKPRAIVPVAGLQWTADAQHVLFGVGSANAVQGSEQMVEVWRVPAAGGELETLGIYRRGVRSLSLSPDSRRLAFRAGEYSAEVWIIEPPTLSPPAAGAAVPPR